MLAIETSPGRDVLFYLGSADRAAVTKVGAALSTEGTFTSSVHDARLPSAWGRVSWRETRPRGSGIGFSTRTGNTREPDETWQEWSDELTDGAGSQVTSAQARFIQYRVTLRTPAAGEPPAVWDVRVAYLTENLAPRVGSLAVTGPGAPGPLGGGAARPQEQPNQRPKGAGPCGAGAGAP